MTETVRHPHQAILAFLMQTADYHRKAYCYPSHETILKRLREWFHLSISDRTLCRHLAAFERDLYITRQRRHRRGRDGNLILRSTIYKIGLRAFQQLARWARSLQLWPNCLHPTRPKLALPETAVNQRLLL